MKAGSTIIGIILGVFATAVIGWTVVPSLMCTETPSPYSVEETAENIKQNALAAGWVVPSITELQKSVKKHGGGELPPVNLINLCQAEHAYNLLKTDENKYISVMMPCTISIYEKSDGKTYVSAMNASFLGKMFGGDIAEVMSGPVAEDQQAFITAAVN
jgi:uncharacterized protein (DUF302 family)